MKRKNSSKNSLKADRHVEVKAPLESPGSYYIRKRKSGNWSLMIETYISGKRKQKTVDEAIFVELGFQKTMNVTQAKNRVHDINIMGRDKKLEYRQKVYAAKKAIWNKKLDSVFFPSEIFELFVEDIESTPGITRKYCNRLLQCFNIVTEMISKIKVMPHEYNSSLNKIVSYIRDQKYSVSYASDIIMLLNRWGKHYCKYKGTYCDYVGKLNPTQRRAIKEAHNSKEDLTRKVALPITREEIENLYKKIDRKNEKHLSYYRWIRASWLFGLRPSELDRVVDTKFKEDIIETINGATCLLVTQTKTVNKEGDRHSVKKIPILSKEQAEAIDEITNLPTERPSVEFIDEYCRVKGKRYKEGLKFDCYSGRKGFTDLMIAEPYNQSLENISVWLGHSNISTSYKFYKDKESLHFAETEYTKKTKKPKHLKSA